MANKKKVFRNIDEFIFNQIDNLKKSSAFQQVDEQFSSLPLDQQKLISHFGTFVMLLLPFLMVMYFIIGNWQMRRELSLKQEIYEYAQQVISQSNEVTQKGRNLYSRQPINSEAELRPILTGLAERLKLSMENFSMVGFTVSPLSTNLQQGQVTINFQRLSYKDAVTLLAQFIQQERFKISQLEMNKIDEYVNGKVGITFFSRPIGDGENE